MDNTLTYYRKDDEGNQYTFNVENFKDEREFFEAVKIFAESYNEDIHILDNLENDEGLSDFQFFYDSNIDSLLEDMQYNGFSLKSLSDMNNARYGKVIDLYKIGNGWFDDYIMAVGMR